MGCSCINNLQLKAMIVIALLVLFLPSVNAETFYISTTGSDGNNGSISSPWHTISYAWGHSGGGDTVFVREGTYTENEIWLHMNRQGNGIENQFWTLKSYPGESAVFTNANIIIEDSYVRIEGLVFRGDIRGNSVIKAVTWSDVIHEHIEILDNKFIGPQKYPPLNFIGNNSVIQGNTVDITNSQSHGMYIMHGSNNVVRNNYVKGMYKYGIHIYDEEKYQSEGHVSIKNLLVENNTVVGSQISSGIIISAGESTSLGIKIDSIIVRNNIVINNNDDGITIRYYGSVRNVDIINNTVYGNGEYGIRISAYDVDDVMIKNNIFSSNSKDQINVSSSLNNLVVSHNLYWQPSSVGSGAVDDYAVYQDPLFVDVEGGDFHLRAGSPAIDAGVDVGLHYNGAAPDLGAFEYNMSTGKKETTETMLRSCVIQQNYPNPFNTETKIKFYLSVATFIDLSVYDSLGQKIATLIEGHQTSGEKVVTWGGKNKNSRSVSSGIYFYNLKNKRYLLTRKMVLQK
jgi:hypothetical protein